MSTRHIPQRPTPPAVKISVEVAAKQPRVMLQRVNRWNEEPLVFRVEASLHRANVFSHSYVPPTAKP
jgi:hypothetical protein